MYGGLDISVSGMIAQRSRNRRRIGIELPQHRGHDAIRLLEQHHQQVLGFDLRVIQLRGELRRRDDCFLRLLRELIEVHDDFFSNFASAS